MKNNNKRLQNSLVFILLFLMSCSGPNSTKQPTSTASSLTLQQQSDLELIATQTKQIKATYAPTVLPSQTPKPSATFISHMTLTPIPTLLPENVLDMVELLQSDDCGRLCYLDITIGATTLSEAKSILERLGASSSGGYSSDDGYVFYTYHLRVGDPEAPQPTPDPLRGYSSETDIGHTVTLITKKNRLIALEVNIVPQKFISEFQEYWSRYSTAEILFQYGPPDQIYTSASTSSMHSSELFLMIYSDIGAIFQIQVDKPENLLCPENQVVVLDVTLYKLGDFESLYGPFNSGRVPPTERDIYLPILETLEIGRVEFYDQLIADPSTCFEIKPPQ